MHFHNLFARKRSVNLSAIILMLFVSAGFNADAQKHNDPWLGYGGGGYTYDSGYAISLNVDYDSPAGGIGQIFKPAPAFNLSVLHYVNNFTFNATLGYRVHDPKQPVFYFNDGMDGVGTSVWGSFPIYALYAGGAWNAQLGGGSKLYFGLNIGIYYTNYNNFQQDQFGTYSLNEWDEQFYFAPKIGASFKVAGDLEAGAEVKCNFFTPSGNNAFDPYVGVLNRSYAAGITLTYRL
jgi:hypothetical protein